MHLIDDSYGVRTYWHGCHHSNEVFLNNVQDVEPVLDFNHSARSVNQNTKHGYKFVARVPHVVEQIWEAESPGITKDLRRCMKKLDDPEWAYLRTTPGRVHHPKFSSQVNAVADHLIARRDEKVVERNQEVINAGLEPVGV